MTTFELTCIEAWRWRFLGYRRLDSILACIDKKERKLQNWKQNLTYSCKVVGIKQSSWFSGMARDSSFAGQRSFFFCCTIASSYSLRYIIRSFAEASSTSGCEVSDGCPSSDQSLVKDEIRSRDLCSGKHLGFAYSLLFTLFLPATRESPDQLIGSRNRNPNKKE